MRSIMSSIALALLLPAMLAAQTGRQPAAPVDTAQRAALEARVMQRFIDRTAAELALSEEQTDRLRTLFGDGVERRRQVARQSAEIRRQLAASVADAATRDGEFERQLAALQELRRREHDLWLREQQALAEVLTPRQRAIYMTRWLALQDNIRELMGRRSGSPSRR